MAIAAKLTKVVYGAMIAALALSTVAVSGIERAAAASDYEYQLVSQSAYPATLNAGDVTNVWIEVKNTGNKTWYNEGSAIARLGTGSKYGNNFDYASEFANSDWLSPNRPVAILHPEVRTGWHTRFQFNIKAPMTNGTYKAYFTPVIDGVTWMQDIGIYWQLMVGNGTTPTTPETPTTPTTPNVVEGMLSASLASTNPASGTFVSGTSNNNSQAAANLAEFTFMGTGSVTALQLKRIGVSADTTLANVYLFDGATRLTDSATVSSNGEVNFTGNLFTVTGSKTISVKSDIAGNTQGQTVGVQLTSYTVGTAAATSASLMGNLHTIAQATLAGIDFTANATPATTNQDPANDVVVWQNTSQVSQRDVWLKRVAFRQIGSINNATDIRNFRLQIDGSTVATVANLDSNGYATFTLATPKTLSTGSHVFKVVADVVGGSSRDFQFSLRAKADIDAVDSSFNVNISPTVASAAFAPVSTGTVTITSGQITIQKTADSPSGDITLNAFDVSLGKYTFTAFGEPIKVETLKFGFATSNGAVNSLRNGRVLANGSQVGSTTTLALNGVGTSYTTNFIVNPGSPVTVELRADLYDNDGTNDLVATDTITARLLAGSSNAQKQISLGSLSIPNGTFADGNQLTVKSGTIGLAKQTSYPNQTTTVPQNAPYKLAAYNLTGSSTEDINLDTFTLEFSTAGTFTAADLTDVYLKVNNVNTTIKPTVNATGNTYSQGIVLVKNAVVPVEVYAKIGSTIVALDTITAKLLVSGTTAASAQAVSTNGAAVLDGQTITAGSADIAFSIDPSAPNAAILDDMGTTSAASFKVSTTNDAAVIKEVKLQLPAQFGNGTVVQSITLKDGSTVLGTNPPQANATDVTFAGLNVSVPANSNKTLTVDVTLATVGNGAGRSGENIAIKLNSVKVADSQGVESTYTVTKGLPLTANAFYVYKAVPTISNLALPSGLLTAGTQTISKFSVNTGGTGSIAWKKVILTLNKTGAPGVGTPVLYDADTDQVIATSTATITGNVNGAGVCDSTGIDDTICTIVFVTTAEQQVSTSKNYSVKSTISGTIATGDNITTSIAQPSVYSVPSTFAGITAGKLGANGVFYTAAGANVAVADTRLGEVLGTLSTNSFAAGSVVAGGNADIGVVVAVPTATSFVWSDQSAAGHSDTTYDWNGSYLVKNLPTNSQTLVK